MDAIRERIELLVLVRVAQVEDIIDTDIDRADRRAALFEHLQAHELLCGNVCREHTEQARKYPDSIGDKRKHGG